MENWPDRERRETGGLALDPRGRTERRRFG